MAWSDHAGQRFHKAFFLISLEGRNVRYPSEGLGRVVEVQFSAGKWSTPRLESPPRIETSSFQSRPWQSARFPTEVGMSIVADRRRQILPADARANYERLTLGVYPRAGHSVGKNLDVLSLRYVGRINFWNADDSGSRLIVVLRKGLSLAVRLLVNGVVSRLLPPHKKTHAPWIVFVAREV